MITWNKDWVQEHESLWGIFEKFKFANRINGKEFFYFFTENRKSYYSSKSIKNKSFIFLKSTAKEKLSKTLNINIDNFNDQLNELSKSPLSDLSIFNDNLCFCKICISKGYHSFLHQYHFIASCPFHPKEKLTDLCPECDKPFRSYDLGYNEKGFCCQNCKSNILERNNLFITKLGWVYPKKIKDKFIFTLFNTISHSNYSAKYVFSTDCETSAINKPVYNLINKRLLEVLSRKKSIPVVIEKRYTYKPAYIKEYDEIQKVGYIHRELLRNYQKSRLQEPDTIQQISKFKRSIDIEYLNQILDLELFIQSKAILKSVDRYIQNKIKRKINLKKEMKKVTIKDPYIKAYIEWKVSCYGVYQTPYKVYNYLGIDEPSFNFRHPFTFYFTQMYPSLLNNHEFNDIISDFKNKGYSFKLIANVFSKVLFNFLYLKFQQHLCKSLNSKKEYFQLDNLPPFIQILKRDNSGEVVEVSFINSYELYKPNFYMIDNRLIKWKTNL
ncbi:hypothetical protein [Solibacillus sp. NPDC093137]|uniref:hypothetical protein n=1 Tax=Solibacillus sp. NPDC093137 TaxID=3390678 RepID=UPI003D0136C5